MSDKPASLFLSYARTDRKRALPLIQALEQAGLQVWWDGLIEGGDNFLPTTEAALEGADAVVVLWSKASIDSHWVRDEATRGRDRKCLVPLSIDGSQPPLGFRQFQVIDFSKWRGKSAGEEFQRLLHAIESLAGRAVPPLPQPPLVSRRALVGGGAMLLAGGGGLAAWLTGLIGGKAAPGNSVAVLPFRNLSDDPEQDYFAQGISEQIRSTLSRNARLRVLAPTSIASVARDGLDDLSAVARKLDVAFLLGGSVRRSGDQLRIAATLTDGKTGFAGWNEEFDNRLEDVFSVQDRIADAVAGVMAAQTAGGARSASTGLGGTSSVKAYDAYLRGNAFYNLRSGEGAYRSALAQYDDALRRDSAFAAAHAARARVIVVITNTYGKASEFKAAYGDALASARKAVELAPELAEAQITLGYVLVQGMLDLRGASAPYEKARKLGTGDARTMSLYSAYAVQMGRKAPAQEAIDRALALDPLNPGTQRIACFVAYCARDYPRAIEHGRKALALSSAIDHVHAYLGDCLLQQGEYAAARKHYNLEGGDLFRLTGLAIVERRLGDAVAADAALRELISQFGDASSYQQAQVQTQWGRLDEAMSRLRFAREIGDVGLALAGTDPLLDPLRERPDFSRLLSELGFG